MNNPDVSIVIVCMNNLNYLYPCLDSINTHTTVSYETLVVAYLFSEDNLQKLRNDYQWITIIESSETRGFSENNNLALRQSKGKYCFVLNDDTLLENSVIDNLVYTMEKLPQKVAVISPKVLRKDRSVQHSGMPKSNCWTYLLGLMRLFKFYETHSKYVNQKGIFKSYNLYGAAFLIKTDIFKSIGWFDERYFFCPEDIAVSTTLNQRGYECWVNDNISLIHYGGGTRSKIQTATYPAAAKGDLMFFGGTSWYKKVFIIFIITFFRGMYMLYWLLQRLLCKKDAQFFYVLNRNTIVSMYNKLSPKEIFIRYYSEIEQ
jgi:GT2 family glycosyltransferase